MMSECVTLSPHGEARWSMLGNTPSIRLTSKHLALGAGHGFCSRTLCCCSLKLFLLLLGFGCLMVIVFYVIDRTQTRHSLRRNFPVLARFRYVFEKLGEFFRQYFFAMDREELPFSRAERAWVYRAAKGADTTVAFGSNLRPQTTRYCHVCKLRVSNARARYRAPPSSDHWPGRKAPFYYDCIF